MIRELHAPSIRAGEFVPTTRVWISDLLAAQPGLVHAMTLSNTNMSLTGGPDRGRVVAHRRALCSALGLPFERLTVAQQVHGCEVISIDPDLAGAGRDSPDDAVPHVDGLCTHQCRHPLMGISADCPLVLLFDPEAPALGIAHAGWRGTLPGIAARLVAQMRSRCGAQPARIWAAIAPSAGPCCFEVHIDVERIARARWPDADRYLRRGQGLTYLDLWAANADQLIEAGIPHGHIEVAGLCTLCDRRFCSFRRDGRNTHFAGLLASLI